MTSTNVSWKSRSRPQRPRSGHRRRRFHSTEEATGFVRHAQEAGAHDVLMLPHTQQAHARKDPSALQGHRPAKMGPRWVTWPMAVTAASRRRRMLPRLMRGVPACLPEGRLQGRAGASGSAHAASPRAETSPGGVKFALAQLSKIRGDLRLPLVDVSPSVQKAIIEAMLYAGILPS